MFALLRDALKGAIVALPQGGPGRTLHRITHVSDGVVNGDERIVLTIDPTPIKVER